MEGIEIKLNLEEINQEIQNILKENIVTQLGKNTDKIKQQFDRYFETSFLEFNKSRFVDDLKHELDNAMSKAVIQAVKETNLQKLMTERIKTLLLDKEFLNQMAMERIKVALGVL